MDVNFETALRYVLIDEGGNDDDPRDRGGRTSRGITQHEYDSWCALKGKPQGDVWQATDEDIRTIYREQYWDPYCGSLPSGVDYLFFDISVNSGRTRAVRQFQQALGITVDGMVGVVTRTAIKSTDPVSLIHKVSQVRRSYYRNLDQFPIYGRGWLNRVNHCENGAIAIHNGNPDHIKMAAPASKTKNALPSTTKVSPEASGATTVATGGILETLNGFKDSISQFVDFNFVKYTLIAIAVASLSYALYGFWHRSQVQKVM